MKPEFIALKKPAVVTYNNRLLAIVGGTRRRSPFEVRWWAFSIRGDIVILERTWTNFIDSTPKELHRPSHREILPQVTNRRWDAAFELGRHYDKVVLEITAHNGLFAF